MLTTNTATTVATLNSNSYNQIFTYIPPPSPTVIGTITGTISSNSSITGYGLTITAEGSSPFTINVTNNGSVSSTQRNGLAIFGNGGPITYSGNGSAGTTAAQPSVGALVGLFIENSNNGSVTVGSQANPITGAFSGIIGIELGQAIGSSNVSGTESAYLSGGSVTATATGGEGIFVDARSGSADATVSTVGNTVINSTAAGALAGIAALTNSGNSTITSNALIGSAAIPFGVGLEGVVGETYDYITQTRGVNSSATGTLSIFQTAGGSIFANTGIYAINYGTGPLDVATAPGSLITAALTGSCTNAVLGANGQAISCGGISASAVGPISITANGTINSSGPGAPGIVANSNSGAVNITVGGNVTSATTGILASSSGPISITNNSGGVINGSTDAIQTSGGLATVSNSGSIIGPLALMGPGSVFNNYGTWTTFGSSTVAANINNAGTLIATGSNTAITAPTFSNLATGVINLRSGTATNQLTLNGNYVGTPGSQLLVSVNPVNGTADKLIVTGNASGSTNVTANYLSNKLVTTPIPFVQSAPGSTATFTLTDPNNGLFNYALNQSSPGTLSLTSALSGTAIVAGTINRITAQVSQTTISGIETQLQERRDAIQQRFTQTGRPLGYAEDDTAYALSYQKENTQQNPATDALAMAVKAPPAPPADLGPKPAVWIQAFDDWNHWTPEQVFGSFTNTYGFQAGFDETWRGVVSKADALVLGIVGGLTEANVTYDTSSIRVSLNGPGFGFYGTYLNGGFSVNSVVKGDWFSLSENEVTMGVSSVSLQNISVAGNVQYKFSLANNWFIEPTAGFTYTNSQYGSGAEALSLEDGYLVRLQTGARFGTEWNWNNMQFGSRMLLLAYDNVEQTGTALQNIGAGIVAPTDVGLVRGEVDAELNADFGKGFSALLRGELRFGEDLVGGAIKVGVRQQW